MEVSLKVKDLAHLLKRLDELEEMVKSMKKKQEQEKTPEPDAQSVQSESSGRTHAWIIRNQGDKVDFTAEDIRAIRAREKEQYLAIAEEYQVSYMCIYNIMKRRTYKWVN